MMSVPRVTITTFVPTLIQCAVPRWVANSEKRNSKKTRHMYTDYYDNQNTLTTDLSIYGEQSLLWAFTVWYTPTVAVFIIMSIRIVIIIKVFFLFSIIIIIWWLYYLIILKRCFIYLLIYECTTFTSSVNVLNENTVRTEGIQITLYFIMSSISLVWHCCFYYNMVCISRSQCETETNITWMLF